MLCHEEDKNEAAKKTICCFKNSTLFLTDSGSSKRKVIIPTIHFLKHIVCFLKMLLWKRLTMQFISY